MTVEETESQLEKAVSEALDAFAEHAPEGAKMVGVAVVQTDHETLHTNARASFDVRGMLDRQGNMQLLDLFSALYRMDSN